MRTATYGGWSTMGILMVRGKGFTPSSVRLVLLP